MNEETVKEGTFEIVSLNISGKTGTRKQPVQSVTLIPGKGIEGDAHAGILDDRHLEPPAEGGREFRQDRPLPLQFTILAGDRGEGGQGLPGSGQLRHAGGLAGA